MSDIDECCSVCFRRVGINTGDDGTPPVDSMAMRIESLAEELAKPEDISEVL